MAHSNADPSLADASSTAAVDRVLSHERLLWSLVLATLVLDVLLTAVGRRLGLAEGNPLVADLLARFGIGALAALKVGIFVLAVGLRRVVPPRYVSFVPLALAVPWSLAVLANVVTIAVVV